MITVKERLRATIKVKLRLLESPFMGSADQDVHDSLSENKLRGEKTYSLHLEQGVVASNKA